MNWTYMISAVAAPRLLMRVALIFDQQSLTLSDVLWHHNDAEGNVAICVRVRCEEALAGRLLAKLLHLQDVWDVVLNAETEEPLA